MPGVGGRGVASPAKGQPSRRHRGRGRSRHVHLTKHGPDPRSTTAETTTLRPSRPRALRPTRPQPPMANISTLGSLAVASVRSSE